MITGINKSKIVAKHILCDCKCKFDDIQFNSTEKWNDVSLWHCEEVNLMKLPIEGYSPIMG